MHNCTYPEDADHEISLLELQLLHVECGVTSLHSRDFVISLAKNFTEGSSLFCHYQQHFIELLHEADLQPRSDYVIEKILSPALSLFVALAADKP